MDPLVLCTRPLKRGVQLEVVGSNLAYGRSCPPPPPSCRLECIHIYKLPIWLQDTFEVEYTFYYVFIILFQSHFRSLEVE